MIQTDRRANWSADTMEIKAVGMWELSYYYSFPAP
jgi:hypothetical protein